MNLDQRVLRSVPLRNRRGSIPTTDNSGYAPFYWPPLSVCSMIPPPADCGARVWTNERHTQQVGTGTRGLTHADPNKQPKLYQLQSKVLGFRILRRRDVLIHSGQSTLMKLIVNFTLSLTNNLIVDLVRFGVTLTIKFAIRSAGRTAGYPSQFRLAPAAPGSPPSTPPRPLIPPSQPRGRDQRSGLQK